MLGPLCKLKAGQQGGGFVGKKEKKKTPASSSGPIGPSIGPASRHSSRPLNSLEAAIKEQHALAQAEARGRKASKQLPEWITIGQCVGYLSSSGRVCEGIIDDISLVKGEVKFIFTENQNVWKCVPFSMIASKENPLRRLAVPGERTRNMTELLETAQNSDIDKSIMLERLVGKSAHLPVSDEEPRPASVKPQPGSPEGSVRSRSRSRSPRPVAEASTLKQCQQLPAWIAKGQRARYKSRSSGKYCVVDIDSVSMDKREVKIIFAEDRKVWKGIPFSMILSDGSPLRPLAAQDLPQELCIAVSP